MANLAEIQKKIKELQAQEADLISKEKTAVINRMLEEIKTYGITAQELGFATQNTQKKQTASTTQTKPTKVVMYRNGDQTWSGGRGKKPQWVLEIISKEGINALEKYKVA